MAVGASLTREDRGRRGRELSLHMEHTALTMQVRDGWRDRAVIDPSDVVSLAIGVMVGF
jgi:hypothetical protein